MTRSTPGKFTIQGLNPDEEGKARDQLDQYLRDWDYTFSSGMATVTMKGPAMQTMKDQAVEQSVETIRNRIDQFGVAEPIIQRYGREQLIVELPGVDNPEHVQSLIKIAAVLEWKLVKGYSPTDEESLLKDFGGKVPDDMEVVKGDPKADARGFYLVSKVATVTGKDLRLVRRSVDEWNQPAVAFQLKPDGARRFEQVTGENIGKQLAIILDKKVQSAPNINARISDSGIIQGHFTIESGGRPGHRPQGRRPAGRDQDPREPDDRALARRGLDPGRPPGRPGRPRRDHGLHDHLLQDLRHQRHRRPDLQPDHPLRVPGLFRRPP